MIMVGDLYPVWWDTGSGTKNMARVLDVAPYLGRYPQHFTHVLRLHAPNTSRGWMEMAVELEQPLLPA